MSAAQKIDPVAPCGVTWWPALLDSRGRFEELHGWGELFGMLVPSGPHLGDEHPGWSPARFEGDRRSLANVREVYALTFDYDAGTPIADALERWRGALGYVHTTRSHTADRPRFRVLLPLRRPVSAAEYSALWSALRPRAGDVDAAAKDPSRLWFTPSEAPGGFERHVLPGEPLDPDALLAAAPRPTPPARVAPPVSASDIERRAVAYLARMPAALSGQGGHDATWRAALALSRGFALDEGATLRLLLSEYNPRCEPPWSERELRHKAAQAAAANVPSGYLLEGDRGREREALRAVWTRDDEPSPFDEAPVVAAAPPPKRRGIGPADVLLSWMTEGPLVHEPTGIAALDEATGGGPVYGSRIYSQGAPDAGKTALMIQIGHTYAARGIAVGFLAVDEEAGDLVTRLAQRIGFSRLACEVREHGAIETMGRQLADLPIRFYDGTWTIEDAAADLAAFAAERGSGAFLGIDSVQTVRCSAEDTAERELSMVHAIEARVRAIRAAASRHRLIAFATSEMGRAGYRSRQSAENVDPMAAGKWSGAIEYSARVLLSLTSVSGVPDTIQVEIPKNKHGRSLRAADGTAFYLGIDRASQTLAEVDAPTREAGPDEDSKAMAQQARREALADRMLTELVKMHGKGREVTGQRQLRDLVTGSSEDKASAVALLLNSGRIQGGNRRPFVPVLHEDEGEVDRVPVSRTRSADTSAPERRSVSVCPSPLRDGHEDTDTVLAFGRTQTATGPTDTIDHPRCCACGDCRGLARQLAAAEFADD